MATARQARELGEALAYLAGDRRDTPWQCGWPGCHSENVVRSPDDTRLRCNTCNRETSMHIAYELREGRARARVRAGAGHPLLCLEKPVRHG